MNPKLGFYGIKIEKIDNYFYLTQKLMIAIDNDFYIGINFWGNNSNRILGLRNRKA
jgi:hypothetical protein